LATVACSRGPIELAVWFEQFRLTLSDLSEGMLAQSRASNPEAEHVTGDMRSIRLNRQFDYVLIHDAVTHMTTLDDLRAAIVTAAVHCRAAGTVVVLPDCVAETIELGIEHGGDDSPDGRGFRYLPWESDPEPLDSTLSATSEIDPYRRDVSIATPERKA
jgi:trans-aconitate methyltransferase